MGSRPVAAWRAQILGPLWLVAFVLGCPPTACARQQPCQDPTHEGSCFCPPGASCHHTCGPAMGTCTLGCSQRNQSCSVSCGDDCTALCAGAQRCEATCGPRCNVSCEWVQERCAVEVGVRSHVNCDGAANCEVRCTGSCDVSCAGGHCRVECAAGADCDLSCGTGAAAAPVVCPGGARVCGRSC